MTSIYRPLTALALLIGAVSLTGCTSTSYTCSNSDCTVTLSGSGASTDLGSEQYTVTLIEADGEEATFSVNGTSATCELGQTVEVDGYSATCEEIGDDRLVVQVTPA